MNNKVLRLISILLGLAAVGVALFAIKLSQAPAPAPAASAPTPAAAPQPTVAVVVATKSIKAGQALLVTDVAVKGVVQPPQQALTSLQDAVGRMAVADIAAGQALTPGMFAADSIAYLLKPGERAIGIKVDEVSGVGGYIKPGEHVDVVGYVPGSDQDTLSTALVIIEDARVLSIGDVSKLDVDADNSAKDASVGATLAKESGVRVTAPIQERRLRMRSAVLAIRGADINKLMTADTIGQIRLALRPPVGFDPNAPLAADTKTDKDGKGSKVAAPLATKSLALAKPSTAPSRKIVIQEGNSERSQDNAQTSPFSFFKK